jgi:hypothetical protein
LLRAIGQISPDGMLAREATVARTDAPGP